MLYQYIRWITLLFVVLFLSGAVGFSLIVN